jgi:LmbE family N-acetylglucosaminyl deacetylase
VTAPAFHAAGPGTAPEVWSHHLAPDSGPVLDLGHVRRLVVVGAHPDDESLGAGGLVAIARTHDIQVDLVCMTDGGASHPDSPTHTTESLARRRADEWAMAAELLGVAADHRHWLGFPDGDAASDVDSLTTALVQLVGDGRGVVIAAPWREDGHPDHAAVGRAAAVAARRTDAELWEYPVWFWHWAHPGDPMAEALRALPLPDAARTTKNAAVSAHVSQVAPLSGLPGDGALLTAEVLAHFAGGHEWFVVTPGAGCPDETLDRLHRQAADPWGVDTRWYERRKRGLLLAMLPRPRFDAVLEIGCSTGALTESLAAHADRVVAVDSSTAAVGAARRRLAGRHGVEVRRLEVPGEWPEGTFDLAVLSEVGYFLSPAALEGVVRRVEECLTPDGVVVLCHWRHPVEGWVPDAGDVHRRFAAGLTPPLQAMYRDQDVELRVHAHEWPAHDR